MNFTVIGKNGAFPKANESASCYLLQGVKSNILIDLGSGALSRLQNFINIYDIDHVIISHFHGDHCSDIESLKYSTGQLVHLRKSKLCIYVPDYLNNVQDFDFGDTCKGYGYNKDTEIKIDEFKITFSENIHQVKAFAINIIDDMGKKLSYTGDTEYYDDLVDFCKNSDILVADSAFYNSNKGKGHMTAGEVGALAQKSNTTKLILTHLPHLGDNELLLKEALANFDGDISLAYEGLKVLI